MYNKSFIQSDKEDIANKFGICVSGVSCSTANGISFYITYRGWRVRFSDHMTSAFSGRHTDEIHVGLNATKESVDSAIDRRNPDNWEVEVVTREKVNTEYGIKKMFPNAISIEIIESRGLSKKSKHPIFLFRVVNKRTVYNK